MKMDHWDIRELVIYFPRYDNSLEVREKNLLTLRKVLLI